MLVVGGRERTEADFRSLLDSTRFSLTRIIPTEASWLIECHPAQRLLAPSSPSEAFRAHSIRRNTNRCTARKFTRRR